MQELTMVRYVPCHCRIVYFVEKDNNDPDRQRGKILSRRDDVVMMSVQILYSQINTGHCKENQKWFFGEKFYMLHNLIWM